jgi:hypothetical protein
MILYFLMEYFFTFTIQQKIFFNLEWMITRQLAELDCVIIIVYRNVDVSCTAVVCQPLC